jgi:hypothetical protein
MLRANLLIHTNYSGADLNKVNRTLGSLENALNSDKFKNAILNFKEFQFIRYKCLGAIRLRTIQLDTYTNTEIYQKIMKGQSQSAADSLMDFRLILAPGSGGSAVGETVGHTTTTYKVDFDGMSEGQLAAHYLHEWMHIIGFEHSFSNKCDPNRDCLSVPYAIGNIIEIMLTGECWYRCTYSSLVPEGTLISEHIRK